MFIRSERLMLRPVFAEDWREIFDVIADHQSAWLLAGVPSPGSADDAREFCSRPSDSAGMLLAITLPGDIGAPIIGIIGLVGGAAQESPRLDWWIVPSWRQCGYGNEAEEALLATARALGVCQMLARPGLEYPYPRKIL